MIKTIDKQQNNNLVYFPGKYYLLDNFPGTTNITCS